MIFAIKIKHIMRYTKLTVDTTLCRIIKFKHSHLYVNSMFIVMPECVWCKNNDQARRTPTCSECKRTNADYKNYRGSGQ